LNNDAKIMEKINLATVARCLMQFLHAYQIHLFKNRYLLNIIFFFC